MGRVAHGAWTTMVRKSMEDAQLLALGTQMQALFENTRAGYFADPRELAGSALLSCSPSADHEERRRVGARRVALKGLGQNGVFDSRPSRASSALTKASSPRARVLARLPRK